MYQICLDGKHYTTIYNTPMSNPLRVFMSHVDNYSIWTLTKDNRVIVSYDRGWLSFNPEFVDMEKHFGTDGPWPSIDLRQ